MKDGINSSFLNNLNDTKEKRNNNDIDDNDDNNYYKKFSKKDKNKKLDEFVKFKPKNSGNQNNGPSLKGAENKVKSILSSFLRVMRNEEKVDKYNKKNPKIKILISKLSNKKIKLNHGQKYTPSNFQKNSLNSFQAFNNVANNKNNNENSTSKLGSGEDNFVKKKPNNKLGLKLNNPHLSTSKLRNNYLNYKKLPSEEYDKSRSKYSSTLSRNTISNFKSSNSNDNYYSKIRSDNSTKNNKSNIITKKNDNSNNYFDKKKNYLKQNSVNYLNIFQKNLILEDNNDDINKKKFINNSSISSKNILFGGLKNTTKKIEANICINKEHNLSLKQIKEFNIINKRKSADMKLSSKSKINIEKRNSEEYNIINPKQGEKQDNYKRKSFQNGKKDFHHNSKKKLIQVGNALKNLQEKLKNSIILRPEDLDFDLNETHRRRTKKNKEKMTTKKLIKPSNKNLTNRKISNKILDDINSTKNEKDMILANSGRQTKRSSFKEKESNKLQKPLPNFDLFKNSIYQRMRQN